MHIKCYVYTKEFPNDAILAKILSPFCYEEEADYPREFDWDWYAVGGRYSGGLKLVVKKDDEKYKWNYFSSEGRAGQLFRSRILEYMNENTYTDENCNLLYCGLRDGYVLCDGAKICDIADFEIRFNECFCLIDPDGNGYAREKWTGNDFLKRSDFDEKAREIYERCRDDCFVTIVDLHT